MLKIVIFVLHMLFFYNTAFAAPEHLTVATLNIKFYGRSITPSQQQDTGYSDDIRDEALKTYINNFLSNADIITFQEITDVNGFKKNVLNPEFTCQTYSHKDPKHLSVLLCYKEEKYDFIKVDWDDNYAIEKATVGRNIRPIIHGLLANKSGEILTYIAAVHLKASKQYSSVRKKQMEILAEDLTKLNSDIPVLVLGDFNTHNTDLVDFKNIFNESNIDIDRVINTNKYTFRVPTYKNKFDYIWTSRHFYLESPIQTSGICRDDTANFDEYTSVEKYNQEISDHCYLKAEFILER
ncbi:MAG: endonuclease/exonuclease/phosphatase family protein [Bdellovibrionota bacterium]